MTADESGREVELPASAERELEQAEGGGEPDDKLGGRILSASPLIWVLLVATLGWAAWATATRDGGTTPHARAVVIPTGERERVVVVPPCSALGTQRSPGSSAQQPGAISAVLPAGGGERVVAVTACRGSGGSAAGRISSDGGGRTALVVLPPGTPAPQPPSGGSSKPGAVVPGMELDTVTRVRPSSSERTVLVPPCPEQRGDGGARAPDPRPSGGGVLLAPCPARGGSG